MILILQEPGVKVKKHSRQIRIERAGKTKDVAIKQIESVLVRNRVHITQSALLLLASHGIPVVYFKRNRPVASFIPFAYHGFVQTRRAQFAAYANRIGLDLIQAIIIGGIVNKARMIRYYARNRRPQKPEIAQKLARRADQIENLTNDVAEVIKTVVGKYSQPRFTNFANHAGYYPYLQSHIGECREQVMALEGRAAKLYFGILSQILPEELEFTERNRRPPQDPVNACLSFGYHLLGNEILTAIITAGLEPYAGFLHSDRSGRPSLVYDLIEEFRQPVVDRLVIRLVQHKILQNQDFENDDASYGVKFTKQGMQTFLGEFYYMMRKQGIREHNYFYSYQRCILRQARRVVRFLLGQSNEYTPFLFKW